MIGHLYGSFYFMRFPVDHRTMHHINKKFNLWKVFVFLLGICQVFSNQREHGVMEPPWEHGVINTLQNTSDVSWIMWKLQWNWDSHSHWSWLQTFNCQPKSIQHITQTVCYHILNFFESTMKMRLDSSWNGKGICFNFSMVLSWIS